jgi:hypothetical protein
VHVTRPSLALLAWSQGKEGPGCTHRAMSK